MYMFFLLSFNLFFLYNICTTLSKTILYKILQNYLCIAQATHVILKRDNLPHLLRYEKNTIFIWNIWVDTNLIIRGPLIKHNKPDGLFNQLCFFLQILKYNQKFWIEWVTQLIIFGIIGNKEWKLKFSKWAF